MKNLRSMVLNGSLVWTLKSPTEALLEMEMETVKQLSKSSMNERDWGVDNSKKEGERDQ